jgi:multidrug resistance efflux pump
VLCVVLLLTTIAFAYRAYRVGGPIGGGEGAARPTSSSTEQTTAATTTTASVGEVVLQVKGYVIPISLVQVSPKVGGQLIWINPNFAEGEKFKEGDELARLEKIEYQAEYDQALATWTAAKQRLEETRRSQPEEIKQAEAEIDEQKQNAIQLRLDVDRNRRMGTALASREMEQTKYSYEATLARIKRLEASLRMLKEGRQSFRLEASEQEAKQAKAQFDRAKWRYDNTTIRAPINGTILTKKAELGNMVNPSAFSSGISASLCEMADLTKLEIDLSIQERDIASVKVGQPCVIMPEAYSSDKEFLARHPQGYKGRVYRLMPTADRAKGAIPVRVRIDAGEIPDSEAGQYLRPELGAIVMFKKFETPEPSTASKASETPPQVEPKATTKPEPKTQTEKNK